MYVPHGKFNDFSMLTDIFYIPKYFVVVVAAYSVASDGRTAGQLFPTVRSNVKGFRNWT